MTPQLDMESGGVTLGPCQHCDQLKTRFYLCDNGHSLCYDCHRLRDENIRQLNQRFERLKNRSPSNVDVQSPPRNTIPKTGSPRDCPSPRSSQTSPIAAEDHRNDLQIFCQACGAFRTLTAVTLPRDILTLVPQSSDQIEGDEDQIEADEDQIEAEGDQIEADEDQMDVDDECADCETTFAVPASNAKRGGRKIPKKAVDSFRGELGTACSELRKTRNDLDVVGQRTEKLGLDVDILRDGVSFLYFNFDSILNSDTTWAEGRICGIPFNIMVCLREESGVPYLGFYIGLDPVEGLAHSPLKKIIVLRAHNAYGKVVETANLVTFEDGECVHPCFDVTKKQDGDLFGFGEFLRKDRILRHDMLKDGRLCLSLQIKML